MRKTTRKEAAEIIDRFLNNSGGEWEWDDFCCSNVYSDPFIQKVADECTLVFDNYPAEKKGVYCSEAGFKRLAELRDSLLEAL